MANKPHANTLTDKAIRNLEPKEKRYYKVVGEPKELYIRISPNGAKFFYIKYKQNSQVKTFKLKEFREGIYSVSDARKDARVILEKLETGKSTIADIRNKDKDKITFRAYYEKFIENKRYKLSPKTLQKIQQRHIHWTLPSLGHLSVRELENNPQIVKDITDLMYAKHQIIETLHRLINEIKNIFDIAIEERVIHYNPAYNLAKKYLTPREYAKRNNLNQHFPALIEKDDIKEFIRDLRQWQPRTTLTDKNAIYLQILCVNRPSNTVSARWADIDLEKGLWTIPSSQMKTAQDHIIPLSSYAIKILKEQKIFSGNFEYVFPSINQKGEMAHLTIGGLLSNIKDLGGVGKYRGKATAHGFRATFDTLCELNSATLQNLGIPYQAPEVALSHKDKNEVKNAYVRQRTDIENLRKLMQWYGDYLNDIEPLGI